MQNMCTIEAELENLLGEFCIKMKGNCLFAFPFFILNSSSMLVRASRHASVTCIYESPTTLLLSLQTPNLHACPVEKIREPGTSKLTERLSEMLLLVFKANYLF